MRLQTNPKRHGRMLAKLKTWISTTPAQRRNARLEHAAAAARVRSIRERHTSLSIALPKEVDTVFYGDILGVQSSMDCELNKLEKRIVRDLNSLLALDVSHSDLVPRIPKVMPRVMSTLRDEDSSASDLATHIGKDPVLVSEVIRLANSPYDRVGEKITTLERAIVSLGRDGLRKLVANAALKPLINLNSGHFTRLSVATLWSQSEKTAIACDCIAKQEKVDSFQAYLAGIVQNVGFTLALKLLDRAFDGSDAPRSQSFHHLFINRSRKLSLLIASEWAFPAPVLEALESQIRPGKVDSRSRLAQILYVGDKLAKIHILTEQGRFKEDIEGKADRFEKRLANYRSTCYARLSA
jgi:HD-like signal output (HDOD) protein